MDDLAIRDGIAEKGIYSAYTFFQPIQHRSPPFFQKIVEKLRLHADTLVAENLCEKLQQNRMPFGTVFTRVMLLQESPNLPCL